jgi:cellobiose-specific phosphotransferase system component IIB
MSILGEISWIPLPEISNMSNIFNEYAKIMEEKGLVKKAESRVDTQPDSDYQDKIKALYGIEIKLNDSTTPIIEQAHPDMVIIAPSYDKVNALVENIQQRHDIMVGIVNKMPNGNLTQHKIAEKELLDELIRLSFTLDNEGHEPLAKQALECADGLTKQAWLGFATKLLTSGLFWKSVGALVGLESLKSNLYGNISQGIQVDTEKAVADLKELYDAVGGSDKAVLGKYIAALGAFQKKMERAIPILSRTDPNIGKIESPQEALSVSSKIQGTREEVDFINKFLDDCNIVKTAIGSGVLGRVAKGEERTMTARISDMSVDSEKEESEVWQQVKMIWNKTVGSGPIEDALASLAALKRSIEKTIADYRKNIADVKENAESEGENAFNIFKQTQGQTVTAPQTDGDDISQYVVQ